MSDLGWAPCSSIVGTSHQAESGVPSRMFRSCLRVRTVLLRVLGVSVANELVAAGRRRRCECGTAYLLAVGSGKRRGSPARHPSALDGARRPPRRKVVRGPSFVRTAGTADEVSRATPSRATPVGRCALRMACIVTTSIGRVSGVKPACARGHSEAAARPPQCNAGETQLRLCTEIGRPLQPHCPAGVKIT